jgi:hypothetical protein
MRPIPSELTRGVFTRDTALALGVSGRMLEGRRFISVFPRVWRHRDHVMTRDDWRRAATLALPDPAHLTGISRIQALRLDHGPRSPIRFVIQGDLHIDIEEIFLHRTKQLPPLDDVGVTPASAFIAYAAQARVIDATDRALHMVVKAPPPTATATPWSGGRASRPRPSPG